MKFEDVVKLLKSGKIGVMPTDTIYGIVGSAINPKVVEEIYKLRKRSKNKPMIILISDLNDLNHFNIRLTDKKRKFLENIWPNPVSVILPCDDEEFEYLHRGKKSLAFRMPNDQKLLEILKNTGPLVVPSANIEGEKPAENIEEARKYFGGGVDFYQDGGTIHADPSTVVGFKNDSIKVIRHGSFQI